MSTDAHLSDKIIITCMEMNKVKVSYLGRTGGADIRVWESYKGILFIIIQTIIHLFYNKMF